ncbi:hypothetical protein [Marinomonas ostreistagni]|uniref:hypothetical protein n=1 Tax=Marinomonas ostreistagni TaxID=359209 RepID=UPI00194E06D1|nr:hypothetical protein [Marinomonas ostreistagni]MBM6550485.1 hypothetical protein [Marinomonas ostreistagni]
MPLKKFIIVTATFASLPAWSQTITREPVEVLYGNQVYSGTHQVVHNTPEGVTVIPPEQPKNNVLANMVVSANPSQLSYLEESNIAKREQEIYREVNQRTEEAPFTVLFTGHIPEEIQQRRLSMMPEVGIFGDQLEKLEADQAEIHGTPDEGEFTEVIPGNRVMGEAPQGSTPVTPEREQNAEAETLSNEEKLERLIGG